MLHTHILMPLLGFVHFRMHIAWCHSKKSIYDYTSHLRSKTFPFIKRPVQQLLPLCPVTNWRLLHDEIIVFIEIFSVAVVWNFNSNFYWILILKSKLVIVNLLAIYRLEPLV